MEGQCIICYEDFVKKIRASPDVCDHVFCLSCLEKCSKKCGSFCPVCKQRYKKILNLDSNDVIQVKGTKRKRTRTLYDFSAACEVCSNDDNSEVLLLCDCCDLGFHMHCLSPPLKTVPAGLWFCPTCIKVEKRLKESKGITKEVEADINSNNKISPSNKISKIRKEKSEIKQSKNNSILEVCHNIITEFEDISVNRNCNKDEATTSSMLNDGFNEIENIDKTFNCEPINACSKYPKYLKTYELKCKKNNSPPDNQTHKMKIYNKLMASNVDELCLKDEQPNDSLLESHLSESINYGIMKSDDHTIDDLFLFETQGQRSFNEENNNKNKYYLAADCLTLENYEDTESYTKENVLESVLQCKTNCENIIENSLINKSLQEITPSASKDSPEKEIENSKPVVTENWKSLSASKSTTEESSKGTFNNLNFEFLKENSKQVTKKKVQFSVFDKISDIDTSEKTYSEIKSFVQKLYASPMHVKHCFLCQDMIFVKSQKYCKICKLKYIKKSVKHENFSKCAKDLMFRNVHVHSTSAIDKQSSSINTSTTDVSIRRQRSLLRKLQKIQASKSQLTTLL